MIQHGIFLMFIGMGVVFIFLTILVYTVQLISVFLQKFFPEEEEALPTARPAAVSRDGETATAIAAVTAFKNR